MEADQLTTILVAVLSIASPIGVAIVKKQSWTKLLKVALPVFLSIVIAVAYYLFTGGNFVNPVEAFLIVYGLQQLAYTTILSKVSEWLEHNVASDDNKSSGDVTSSM